MRSLVMSCSLDSSGGGRNGSPASAPRLAGFSTGASTEPLALPARIASVTGSGWVGVGESGSFDRDYAPEQGAVVQLALVDEDVRVRLRAHEEMLLADELADPRPGHSAQVEQRDAPMPEIARAEERHSRCLTRLRNRRPQSVTGDRSQTP